MSFLTSILLQTYHVGDGCRLETVVQLAEDILVPLLGYTSHLEQIKMLVYLRQYVHSRIEWPFFSFSSFSNKCLWKDDYILRKGKQFLHTSYPFRNRPRYFLLSTSLGLLRRLSSKFLLLISPNPQTNLNCAWRCSFFLISLMLTPTKFTISMITLSRASVRSCWFTNFW